MDSSLDSILSGEQTQPAEVAQPEPVETQAPAEVANEAEESTGEKTGAPPEPQKDDQLEKARKGLEAATKAERERRQAAEQRAQQLERELQAFRQQTQPKPQEQQPQQPFGPEPKREEFTNDAEYVRALVRHERQVQKAEDERQAAETKAQQEAQELYTKTEGIYAQAQALEGFNRAAFDALPLTKPIVEALVDSDNAAALMHFMAANPAEVDRIAGLSHTRQIKELDRIEAKLAEQAAAEPKEPAPKEKPQLPETLTQARNAKGQFEPAYSGPTPLNAILK